MRRTYWYVAVTKDAAQHSSWSLAGLSQAFYEVVKLVKASDNRERKITPTIQHTVTGGNHLSCIQKRCFFIACCAIIFLFGCSTKRDEVREVKHYPLDTLDGIISQSGIALDKDISSDQRGSLRITTESPTTVRLFETGDLSIDNARLIYQARLRTAGVGGQVYLEMWCHFPGKGEFFSRALHAPLTGTTEWTTQETLFFLKKGEDPDDIKLNLVINGKGTVWIDDLRLITGPLL
jgi:hypothetical protein